ncbi:MAG: enoyl-CoA hydratase/isomerase family protein [Parahaliea sp.]
MNWLYVFVQYLLRNMRAMKEFLLFMKAGTSQAMTDTIVYSRKGDIAQLLLNIPKRHNALGEEQLLSIQAILEMLLSASDKAKVLVVRGTGEQTFCAGAALNELNNGRISGEMFQSTTDKLASIDIPTIAAVNGNAFGGGVELALACDFRIGIEEAKIRVPPAILGLCYPANGIKRFVQRLGVSVTKRLLLSAEVIEGRMMKEVGFLDMQVPRENFDQSVNNFAIHLSSLAPLSLKAMKVLIDQAATGTIDNDLAEKLIATCLSSEDIREGFSAIKERRSPLFQGK